MSDRTASRRSPGRAGVAAAICLAIAGCGGGDEDSSRAQGDPRPAPDATGVAPRAGSYDYRTRGYERVRAVITARLRYPGRSTVTYRRAGCGQTERWSAGTRRSTTSEHCLEPGGRRLRALLDVHEFFGQPFRLRYRCKGPVVAPPRDLRPGQSWTDRCRALGADVVAPQRVVAVERLRSGGRRVRAVHLRTRARFGGVIRGASTIDSWLRRRDGLLLRRIVRSDSRVQTPIGRVGAHERYEIALRG